MNRAVYVPGCERWVTLGAYVRAIQLAKANPDAEFKHSLTHWAPCKGRRILKEFLAGVHDRINQGVSYLERGLQGENR